MMITTNEKRVGGAEETEDVEEEEKEGKEEKEEEAWEAEVVEERERERHLMQWKQMNGEGPAVIRPEFLSPLWGRRTRAGGRRRPREKNQKRITKGGSP